MTGKPEGSIELAEVILHAQKNGYPVAICDNKGKYHQLCGCPDGAECVCPAFEPLKASADILDEAA